MDVLLLSRLQFAIATFFHFIFVPLTLGLSVITAIMETMYARTGDKMYLKMTKFWGKLFLINFAMGVVTGITLEFQFGTNWSRYSKYVGDIFGSLLAIEATAAFFLESTFIGVWVFGWKKLSAKAHAIVMWLVAGAATLSAIWIILANGFMQHPLGYVIRNGRAELNSFTEVLSNDFAWSQFIHNMSGSYALAGFFVMGISAYHLLKKQQVEFFTRSFKFGMAFAVIFTLLVAGQGHHHGNQVAHYQPAKLAAMESHWETRAKAPMYLLQVPSFTEDKNALEALPVPSLLSVLAFNDPDAVVKGLNDFPKEDRPPVALTFLSFRGMVGIGTAMLGLALWAFWRRKNPSGDPLMLKVLLFAIPLPYLAMQMGWAVAEVGRQPWIVYGLMRTKDAVSPVNAGEVAATVVAFVVVYSLLTALDIFLMAKFAKAGPHE